MRYSLTLLLLCLFASCTLNKFAHLWASVDYNAEGEKAVKTLPHLKEIYRQAKARDDKCSQARAAILIASFSGKITEEKEAREYKVLDSFIRLEKGVVKALLLSRKGNILNDYMDQTYYQNIHNTPFEVSEEDDIRLWQRDRFEKEITTAYLASLEDTTALQHESLSGYKQMLQPSAAYRYLRPTLYDLLAHRTLDYFYGHIRGFTELDSTSFAPAAVFAAIPFNPADTADQIKNSLEIYRRLIRFHSRSRNIDALLEVDLERLAFARPRAMMPQREEWYEQALEQLYLQYANSRPGTLCAYTLASHYQDKANAARDSSARKIFLTKAFNLCTEGSRLFAGSEGNSKCRELRKTLLEKKIDLKTEQVNEPGKPFRVLVNYRNMDKVFFRLVRVDQATFLERDAPDDKKMWAYVTRLSPMKSWEQTLRDPLDYSGHTVEIKADALGTGRYLLIASENQPFRNGKMALTFITVSNIACISTAAYDYYALNRSTGEPLKGVKLVMENKLQQRTYTTDEMGHITLPLIGNNTHATGIWINGTDTLQIDQGSAMGTYDNSTEEVTESISTYFYADRSIYRPGQTVHFKGIRTKGKEQNSISYRIDPGVNVKVFLMDNNYRKVDSLQLRTNDFGSYTGSFKLPPQLTGSFTIENEDSDEGSLDIEVEEYKRPKFQVTFDAIKNAYRINDSVRITGHATAFSGGSLSNVNVIWRVLRSPVSEYGFTETRVAAAQTVTDASGNFQFTFCAIPDRSRKDDQPFNYEITADVTDANGETRTGTEHVQIGYHEIILSTDLGYKIKLSDLKNIRINSRNSNGDFVPAQVTVTFTRLDHPGRLVRERYWERPDQFVMTEKEYHRYFPLDVYKDEDDPATWSKGRVYQQEGTTAADKKWDFSQAGLTGGTYEMLITKGEIKNKHIITIADKESNDDPAYTWYFDYDKTAQPGNIAEVNIGISGNTWLLLQEKNVKGASLQKMTGNLEKISIPVKETDRGNKLMALAYVKDNRLFTHQLMIAVPWTNKQLDISIAAHRNKLLPGEKETWQLTVKTPDNKHPAAELMATMYDASLDEIMKQQWTIPSLFQEDQAPVEWSAGSNFTIASSINTWGDNRSFWDDDKIFDRLSELMPGTERDRGEINNFQGALYRYKIANADTDVKMKEIITMAENPPLAPAPRKDFRETALFVPQLTVNGRTSITFTMPEALSKWKFLAFAHTKDLQFGTASSEVITQKPLMVIPNTPRFLREGDSVILSAKISNVTDGTLTGKAKLELIDPDSKKMINTLFSNNAPVQNFKAAADQSTAVSFRLKVPQGYTKPLIYRITAQSGNFTDGEEAMLPVLSNRILLTASMPIYIRGDGKKEYTFEGLSQSNKSETLQHQAVTVSYNSNPVWYAVQSLPYLMEFPHECAEQLFSRYYANMVATQIVKTIPRVKAMIKQLPLEQDEEVKSALLEETPWLREAKDEDHLAVLMDLERMSRESDKAYKQLQAMQLSNGAFPWFSGMEPSSYITMHVLTGIGRLRMMKMPVSDEMVKKALPYLDDLMKEQRTAGMDGLQYLYMRSYFPEYPSNDIVKRLTREVEMNWKKQSVYGKGMTALVLFRQGKISAAKSIIAYLKENATQSEEMGMYWSSVRSGYYWYDAPVETQALLIEAFSTITKDQPAVDALKTWLLKQKQTNSWSTTRSTADACYALLMQGSDWLNATPEIKITIGTQTISNNKDGNIKVRFEKDRINAKMGKVTLNVKGNGTQPSWGAVYWQYFEQLDKIAPAASGLSIQRELYLQKNGKLSRISATQPLHVGDKVTMRIVLKADRDMEFVHLKDMRPACLEPINVLSEYRNGYYQSTKDLATHFFFDRVGKGAHVLEYSLFVSHVGNYAGGISTAQCMYAPEFSTNSAGMNVVVE